jgi:hypothetical protein
MVICNYNVISFLNNQKRSQSSSLQLKKYLLWNITPIFTIGLQGRNILNFCIFMSLGAFQKSNYHIHWGVPVNSEVNFTWNQQQFAIFSVIQGHKAHDRHNDLNFTLKMEVAWSSWNNGNVCYYTVSQPRRPQYEYGKQRFTASISFASNWWMTHASYKTFSFLDALTSTHICWACPCIISLWYCFNETLQYSCSCYGQKCKMCVCVCICIIYLDRQF